MRTYKDAKLMAKSLRDALAARSFRLSHSECLEIVAKQLGFADWNTLSAIAAHKQIGCSFCGASKHEVQSLIEGGCRNPALPQCVFICDKCVAFSAQVIDDSMDNAKETPELTA